MTFRAAAMGPAFRRVRDYFLPPPIGDRSSLQAFLSGESSYLAQRSTYEFCRNTLSYFGQHMFADPGFNDAMRVNRWESFAAILAVGVLLTRNRVAGRTANGIGDPLLRLFEQALVAAGNPPHRSGWSPELDSLRVRLADESTLTLGPSALAGPAARRVFETLPVYSHARNHDYDGIERAIRFGLIAIDDRMERRYRTAALAADLGLRN